MMPHAQECEPAETQPIEASSRLPVGKDDALSFVQIGGVVAVGLLVRVAVLWLLLEKLSAQWFFHRGMEMGLLAQSIVQGHGLSSPFGGSTGPTAFIAPGYPFIVAGIFALFGTYSQLSAVILMAINIGLNLITILFIMRLAVRFSNARVAVLAGLFWALSPPLIWLPTIFWDTSLSCLILIAALCWAMQLECAPSTAGFITAGAFIAIAGLINPALLPNLFALLCWVAFRRRRTHRFGLICAILTLVAVFSPWPIRNARVFHAFIPLRSTVGFEMWMGNRPQSNGFLDESVFPTFNASELRNYVTMGEVAYIKEKSDEARHYIASHPFAFFLLSLRRAVRFWIGRGNQNGSPFFVIHACATSFLGLAGLVVLKKRPSTFAVIALLPLLFFPLPYYMTHAEFRYRLVIDPLLCVLSACALGSIMVRQGSSR